MKSNFLKAFAVMFFIIGLNSISLIAQDTKTVKASTKTIVVDVEGMTCQKGCADGLDRAFKKTDGVLKSQTLLSTGKSKIKYDPSKVDEKKLMAIIEEKGYTATITKSNQ